ncbi:hypothetical protein TWF102_002209 [Orbilia oligospora]|uniref:RNase III domain-containing protein n=1 Tax=Orbilia oligospora TaxID=2813651 RepID=A0A7C8IXL1_ORBOL|nr:hypothetical protein TWF102_002209 [Orbilia oligospora]KAF3088451.1 hypothetical protein TWF103_001137 [Orbilia oligospora]KAF3092884.1 hypothetical protein TWF706_008877 [Orbilia oligospora]KAF3120340.1 hypothetical protein TWF703_002650 [Orbilia oligospora]KAF3135633.1 hypothetical protein TWF594_008356 [Orbilia oligospora]
MAKVVNIQKIQNAIGYVFKSNTLVGEALESTGHARLVSGKGDGHRRLALLGDKVLGLVQIDQWYGTQQNRGIADVLLKDNVTNRRLQECADQLGITSEILVAPEQAYLHLQGGQIGRVTSASAVEALLGAVWLDSNRDFEQVKKVVCKLGIMDKES